jgi:hypothetical protein
MPLREREPTISASPTSWSSLPEPLAEHRAGASAWRAEIVKVTIGEPRVCEVCQRASPPSTRARPAALSPRTPADRLAPRGLGLGETCGERPDETQNKRPGPRAKPPQKLIQLSTQRACGRRRRWRPLALALAARAVAAGCGSPVAAGGPQVPHPGRVVYIFLLRSPPTRLSSSDTRQFPFYLGAIVTCTRNWGHWLRTSLSLHRGT